MGKNSTKETDVSNIDKIREAAKIAEMPHKKKVYMAQKELMNKCEAMVDVIMNFNDAVKTASDRWNVSREFLINWMVDDMLPFERTDDSDNSDDEEDFVE